MFIQVEKDVLKFGIFHNRVIKVLLVNWIVYSEIIISDLLNYYRMDEH